MLWQETILRHINRRPYVLTSRAQLIKDTVLEWLKPSMTLGRRPPFLLVGPDGCGKEQLLRHCFETDNRSEIITMHCSAQTSAEHVEQILLGLFCLHVMVLQMH